MVVEGAHGLEARVTSSVSTFPVSLWIALLYGSMFNGSYETPCLGVRLLDAYFLQIVPAERRAVH